MHSSESEKCWPLCWAPAAPPSRRLGAGAAGHCLPPCSAQATGPLDGRRLQLWKLWQSRGSVVTVSGKPPACLPGGVRFGGQGPPILLRRSLGFELPPRRGVARWGMPGGHQAANWPVLLAAPDSAARAEDPCLPQAFTQLHPSTSCCQHLLQPSATAGCRRGAEAPAPGGGGRADPAAEARAGPLHEALRAAQGAAGEADAL